MKALLPNIIRTVFRRMTLIATLGLSLSVVWPAWAAPPFTDNGNGTVTDASTSLVWDQCIVGRSGSTCLTDTPSVPKLYDWPGALAAAVTANAANYKGHNDWRVPNVKELESITKLDTWTSGQAAIDAEAFPNTPISGDSWGWGGTWTSTTYAPGPSLAWVVGFYYGGTLADGKANSYYVRLVRSGQSLASFDGLGTADLSITTTDAVATAVPGGSVTYTITASNAGPSAVSAATVADTFPASCSAVSWTCAGAGGGSCSASGSGNLNDTSVNLPVGASVTYTANCTISAAARGSLVNTATVSSATSDPTPGNNSATDTDTLTPQADLSITKTDGSTTATPGGNVTYTITASNAGPSNAPGTTVTDTVPASLTGASWTCVGAGGGTCTGSGSGNLNDTHVNLPAGASVIYTLSATLSSAASGTLSNTATVTAAGGITDPTPGNNSATDTDTISAVLRSVNGTSPVGGTITAAFSGGNAGCAYASTQFTNPTPPPGVTLPHGTFGFTTNDCGAGAALSFTISYPQALPVGTRYYKFGPTADNATPHWYVLESASLNAGRTQFTFTITDNGVGDSDPRVGFIADPGGPGVPLDAATATSIPTLSEWGMILLSGLLALFGLARVRQARGLRDR